MREGESEREARVVFLCVELQRTKTRALFFAVTSPRTYNPQHENSAWREGAAPVTAGAARGPSVDLESISSQVQRCFLKILVFRFPGERK